MKKNTKTSFPAMAVSHWWKLRSQFKRHIPGVVTKSYLSTVLSVKESTARQCVLPELRALGFIDEYGKTSKGLLERWRQDSDYPLVCSEMRNSVYPDELTQDVSSPLKDRKAVTRWFSQATGSGTSRVKKMVSFYTLLCAADPRKGKSVQARKGEQDMKVRAQPEDQPKDQVQEKTYGGGKREWTMPDRRRTGVKKEDISPARQVRVRKKIGKTIKSAVGGGKRETSVPSEKESVELEKGSEETQTTSAELASVSVSNPDQVVTESPGLQVNVQVHFSADVSPTQIDQIFKSMADHLFRAQSAPEEIFTRPKK